jgi:hypothetical protein
MKITSALAPADQPEVVVLLQPSQDPEEEKKKVLTSSCFWDSWFLGNFRVTFLLPFFTSLFPLQRHVQEAETLPSPPMQVMGMLLGSTVVAESAHVLLVL